MVWFGGLGSEDAGVAAGAVEVAGSEGAEEFGEEGVGGLWGVGWWFSGCGCGCGCGVWGGVDVRRRYSLLFVERLRCSFSPG